MGYLNVHTDHTYVMPPDNRAYILGDLFDSLGQDEVYRGIITCGRLGTIICCSDIG